MLLRYVDDIFDTESSTATIGVDFRVSQWPSSGVFYPYHNLLRILIMVASTRCKSTSIARYACYTQSCGWFSSEVAKRAEKRRRVVQLGAEEWRKQSWCCHDMEVPRVPSAIYPPKTSLV